nr:hypothetical protein [uncultured Subdoligranulum sp.]
MRENSAASYLAGFCGAAGIHRLHPVALQPLFPYGCSPGVRVPFLRISFDTWRRLLWGDFAIFVKLFLA